MKRTYLRLRNNDVVVGSGGALAPVAPTPALPASHPSSDASLESLRDILGFGAPRSNTDVEGPKPAAPVVRDPGLNTPPAAAPAPAAPARADPNILELTRAVHALATKPPAAAVTPQDDPGPFSVAIPPAFMDALESEDKAVRTRAVQNLWNSAMNNSVLWVKEFLAEQVIPTMRNAWNADVQGALEAHATLAKFYGTWRNLDNAVGRKLSTDVSVVLLKRAAAAGQTVDPRSDDFLNEVGLVTTNLVRQNAGLPPITLEDLKTPVDPKATSGVSSSNGHPRTQPAFIAKPGARPAPVEPDNQSQDDLAWAE